ncbi:MAG: hypothetical protein K8U57_14805 [Planctomycetes bacterium]|nr:hypothetical protein [Planctomycetota bacterium]
MQGRVPATDFDRAWQAQKPVLSRQATVLFDDPRLRPAPSPDDLLNKNKPVIEARWPVASPEAPAQWFLVELTRELLGFGWTVYDGTLRGMIRRKVWSDADVDELLQGAAATSIKRLPELVTRPRPLFGWLCMFVRQERVEWLRRGIGRLTFAPYGIPEQADTGTTPTQAERLARVRDMYEQVLASLEAEDAELLGLTAAQGLGPSQIANMIGVTDVNARQRIFRARCAAARAWQNLFPQAAAELAEFGVFPPGIIAS